MSESVRAEPASTSAEVPVVVKKYANRRLYNTESSSYITLDTLADMVRQGSDFVVYDAKSGEDITRSVLTQIIVEEEGKGRALLPTGFLRQLIGFYGDSMQSLVPRYLEEAMAAFARQQDQVRKAMQQTMGSFFPMAGSGLSVEEMGRQNMAIMERAMGMFAPFYRGQDVGDPRSEAAGGLDQPSDTGAAEIAALRAEVEMLRRDLAEARAAAAETDPKSNRRAAARTPR